MRLWTVHPCYLDCKGLVALWREALLAQAVLRGETTGYVNHPQLQRFHDSSNPMSMISFYLRVIHEESRNRGYHFNQAKIRRTAGCDSVNETEGQLLFEWQHLLEKLKGRSPLLHMRFKTIELPEPHPLFHIIAGEKKQWEKS